MINNGSIEALSASQIGEIDRLLYEQISSTWQKNSKIVALSMGAAQGRFAGVPDRYFLERLVVMSREKKIEIAGEIETFGMGELRFAPPRSGLVAESRLSINRLFQRENLLMLLMQLILFALAIAAAVLLPNILD